MGDFGRAALRPLKHFADFRGRSTRTEVVAFYLFVMGVELVASVAATLVDGQSRFGTIGGVEIKAIGSLVFALPFLALATRRMHDQGRSGWWLLAAASPFLAAAAWKFARTGGEFPVNIRFEELPVAAALIVTLSALAILVLLLWKDDEETNRYGPNPRYDAPAEAKIQPAQLA
jgi:uncharacterized membrane protein YhaH (DUF805 family)